jgi:xanthine dehydrogenase YagS FAD-binding subunit
MSPFTYERAATTADAIRLFSTHPNARYLGGGTNLVDLMRETIDAPETLVDVTGLSGAIEARADGSIVLGAGAKNTAVAAHRDVRSRFPLLARAVLAGASGQIRNMATVGGNLMQRTRCYYFYDDAARCNKRTPGAGCDAVGGFNRIHAILGASDACVATHPSDLCVALVALDATVAVEGPDGARTIPFAAFHRLPGDDPSRDTTLEPGELITSVTVPPLPFARHSTYRKVRDRASYAFALVSVAAAIDVEGDRVKDVRLALGGVAHKPWRATAFENALRGRPATEAEFRRAADAELAAAKGLAHNAFKIDLARCSIAATLVELTDRSTTGGRP